MNSRGFVKLSTIIAVALGCGFVASVFLNLVQSQRAEQDHKLLQGEITDLRYQVNQDKLALNGASPSPTPSPSPDATPEPSVTPSPTPAATPTPAPLCDTSRPATIKAASVEPNLRAEANSTSTAKIYHVPAGTAVALVDGNVSNGYCHVTISGQMGYVLDSYLQY